MGLDPVRRILRQCGPYLRLRELNREGWGHALRRVRVRAAILDTPPVRTAAAGPVEVRVLTWRLDWINLIWALKSFYRHAGVNYPLYIHDGGLSRGQDRRLLAHFPDATFVGVEEADQHIRDVLAGRTRCLEYRERNVSMRKLLDFYAFSEADYLVIIDSDIVFFRRPDLLIVPPEGLPRNRYNRDCDYWYSMSLDELEQSFGVRPPPLVNSGLGVVRRTSIDFDAIEAWLAHPKLVADTWVTEQTLHALCSTVHGIELLPESYRLDVHPGLDPDTVCKHYPGAFHRLLYTEGIPHLIASGFLQALRAGGIPESPSPSATRGNGTGGLPL
jgi:hypothetical protein